MHENEYLSYEGTQELISYIKKDIAGAQSAPAGNPLTLTDCAPINAESLVVELEPKQDLHGQSAPYVGGAGKNKLPMTVDGIKAANTDGTWSGNAYTISGVTFTILTDDGGNVTGIDYSGTPSANPGYAAMYIVNGVELPSGNYILNGGVSNNAFLDTSLSGSYVTSKGGDTPIVVSGSAAYVRAVVEGNTAYSGTLLPMIRLATETDPTFAPYSNICPITGYTECEVDDVGFNQWDEEWRNGYYDASGSFYTDANYLATKNPIPVKGNKTSYFYCNSGNFGRIVWTDIDGNFISTDVIQNKNFTRTSPNNAMYLQFDMVGAYGNVYKHDISINYPSTVTTYQPYHSSNATIQFGQTVYGGKSNFTEGGTDSTYGYDADLGAAGRPWWAEGDGVFRTELLSSKFKGRLYCSMYKGVQKDWPDDGEITVTNSQVYQLLRIKDTTCAGYTAPEFAAHISGCQLAYELATPTQLSTPPSPLKLLKGTNHINTNGTTINLGYQPDNALGQVLGEAYKYTDKKTAGGSGNYMEKGVDYVTAGQASGSTLGTKATAEGNNTYAIGENSHAEGYLSTAEGNGSHAEGGYTYNDYNYPGGYAKGKGSHAEGYETSAIGDQAHAEGTRTCAGEDAHAEGVWTAAIGGNAHAEGYWSQADGLQSHAEGGYTYAKGDESHAEGRETTAYGSSSHTEGSHTYAGDSQSHAEGNWTSAYGKSSHSEGYRTCAYGIGSHAEGADTSAIDNYSHAQGYKTYAQYSSHAEGTNTTASGSESHAEGTRTYAKGGQSHAEGEGTTASGSQSHVEGNNTYARGNCSHAEGSNTTAFYNFSHAEGAFTYARDMYSHAEGYKTSAYGSCSHAEGSETSARGGYTHAEGCHTTASNHSSHAGGHYNAAMTTGGSISNQIGTAFVIGNGTANDILSNAFSVEFDGTVHAAGAQVHPAADYAEFFEWVDGNPRDTDRVGYFVTTDKTDPTKITLAEAEDDYVLGIVSGAPCVIGNGDCDVWNGMTIKDDFGRTVYIEPGVPKYNPNYDPTKPYVSRMDRKEWAAVGMLGVLPVHDDGTCQVGGFCTVGQRGYATKADKYDRNGNCYKVIERVSDKVVKVIFR